MNWNAYSCLMNRKVCTSKPTIYRARLHGASSTEGGDRGLRTLFRVYIIGYQVHLYQKPHKITQENCIDLEIQIFEVWFPSWVVRLRKPRKRERDTHTHISPQNRPVYVLRSFTKSDLTLYSVALRSCLRWERVGEWKRERHAHLPKIDCRCVGLFYKSDPIYRVSLRLRLRQDWVSERKRKRDTGFLWCVTQERVSAREIQRDTCIYTYVYMYVFIWGIGTVRPQKRDLQHGNSQKSARYWMYWIKARQSWYFRIWCSYCSVQWRAALPNTRELDHLKKIETKIG